MTITDSDGKPEALTVSDEIVLKIEGKEVATFDHATAVRLTAVDAGFGYVFLP